jgi:hypothetical protein
VVPVLVAKKEVKKQAGIVAEAAFKRRKTSTNSQNTSAQYHILHQGLWGAMQGLTNPTFT